MNYREFLFYNLTQVTDTKHPLRELEYDLAFGEVSEYYEEFCNSNYNDEALSEYDAITNFLNNY